LFYSKKKDFQKKKEIQSIQQINFVPTLSFILGIPIPYSNIGHIIKEYFEKSKGKKSNKKEKNNFQILNLYYINMKQILRYLKEYNLFKENENIKKQSKEIQKGYKKYIKKYFEETLKKMIKIKINERIEVYDKNNKLIKYIEYKKDERIKLMEKKLIRKFEILLKIISDDCRKIWATFDMFKMGNGIIILIVLIVFFIFQFFNLFVYLDIGFFYFF
jgi:GPI ethanolamine phosphate transferase 3 subunit O